MVGRNGIWPHRHEEGNNVVVHADVVWMVLVHKGWGRYGVAACGVNGIRSCIILDMNRNIPLYKAYSLQWTYQSSRLLLLRYADFVQ